MAIFYLFGIGNGNNNDNINIYLKYFTKVYDSTSKVLNVRDLLLIL